MKCPFQTTVIHKPQYSEGYTTYFAKDITQFGECLKSECPFYYTKAYDERIRTEHCRRAESEAKECGK